MPNKAYNKKIIASIEIDHPIVLLVASRRKNVAAIHSKIPISFVDYSYGENIPI